MDEWDDDSDRDVRPRRRRRSSFRRVVSFLKLAFVLMPLGLFVYGSVFTDCRSRLPSADWGSILSASACARSEILGNALSMHENLAMIRRLID